MLYWDPKERISTEAALEKMFEIGGKLMNAENAPLNEQISIYLQEQHGKFIKNNQIKFWSLVIDFLLIWFSSILKMNIIAQI